MLHIIEDDFLHFQFFQYISNYFISNKTVSLTSSKREIIIIKETKIFH